MLAAVLAMGVHSSFFGPIKYAILPQHMRKDEVLGATGLVGGWLARRLDVERALADGLAGERGHDALDVLFSDADEGDAVAQADVPDVGLF